MLGGLRAPENMMRHLTSSMHFFREPGNCKAQSKQSDKHLLSKSTDFGVWQIQIQVFGHDT